MTTNRPGSHPGKRAAHRRGLRFVDVVLRGIGRVMFQDNPLSGLLLFIAIGWGVGRWRVPEVAVAGSSRARRHALTAYGLRVDDGTVNAGPCGFNGYLVGLGSPPSWRRRR